jgi:hypothetical protein
VAELPMIIRWCMGVELKKTIMGSRKTITAQG